MTSFSLPLGVAGMVAKTAVAPLDRIKILVQGQNKHYKHLGKIVFLALFDKIKFTDLLSNIFPGVFPSLGKIIRTEGPVGLFRGNGAQMVRMFPYSALQFSSFEVYKKTIPRLTGIDPQENIFGSFI